MLRLALALPARGHHCAGCPMVAVAVDHPADEPELVDRAHDRRPLALSSVEGACRAAPLGAVVAEPEPLLDSAARQTFP